MFKPNTVKDNSLNENQQKMSTVDDESIYKTTVDDTNTALVEWKDTIAYVPPVKTGVVIKVYDGDTITIATKLHYPDYTMYRFSVRLSGIDSPEIKSKSLNEKRLAVLSKHALTEQIIGKTVELKNVSMEKYGRLLADVYSNDIHINKWMLEKGFAVPYSGQTKKRPTEWDDEE
jgi:endonuclease YncB( thermonuclease family)